MYRNNTQSRLFCRIAKRSVYSSKEPQNVERRGPLRGLGLRVSMAFFNGLRAPKDKIAVLQGSIACSSGLQGLYFLEFETIVMRFVWAPGLQRPPPFGGLKEAHNLQQQLVSLHSSIKGQVRGVMKLLLKSNLTSCWKLVVSSFQVFKPLTFINSTIYLLKLGQISLPFCILYEFPKVR